MAELFTTFESVSPPDIVTPDVQQNYQEIQLMQQPTQEVEDSNIDWSFLDVPEQDIQKPTFNYTPSKSEDTSSMAQKVVNYARQFLGGKYSWGGSSPSSGFDCSGLIKYVFNSVGINLPRSSTQQGKVGQEINLQQAQPGDIIWFGSKNSPSGQHMGLISKIDNGQIYIIDAAGKKLGIVERPLPNLQIKSVRRILGGSTNGITTFANGISQQMAEQIKKMEGGPQTAKVNTQFGESFATGAYGMTREFDKPGAPAIKAGTKFSKERWDNIFNAFYSQRAKEWRQVLAGLPNVTQDKIDALSSISASGNWASPNGKFGKFIVQNWNNPQAIYNKWIRTGITARGNGKVYKGLIKRRQLEANWFLGNKLNFDNIQVASKG